MSVKDQAAWISFFVMAEPKYSYFEIDSTIQLFANYGETDILVLELSNKDNIYLPVTFSWWQKQFK